MKYAPLIVAACAVVVAGCAGEVDVSVSVQRDGHWVESFRIELRSPGAEGQKSGSGPTEAGFDAAYAKAFRAASETHDLGIGRRLKSDVMAALPSGVVGFAVVALLTALWWRRRRPEDAREPEIRQGRWHTAFGLVAVAAALGCGLLLANPPSVPTGDNGSSTVPMSPP